MLKSARIKTEVPGPKSRDLMERRKNSVSSGVEIATPVFVQEVKGALLTDVDGNTFIDFGGGIGVLNVGHYEPYVELAERLNALVPGDFEKRSAFFTSGAEAVENAIKRSRAPTRGAKQSSASRTPSTAGRCWR